MTDPTALTPGDDSVDTAEVSTLSYEEARDELRSIVVELESGAGSLDQVLRLFKRGSALAEHCSCLLERANDEITTIEQGMAKKALTEGENGDAGDLL